MNVIDELRQAATVLRDRAEAANNLAEWLEREATFDETYVEKGAAEAARLVLRGGL
jgi:hypothetical protein